MSTNIQKLLDNYLSEIKHVYGSHLKSVILYGSYARGDYTKDSDIDIMILVDLPDSDTYKYTENLADICFNYNVEHDLWIMPIVKNIDHFNQWRYTYPFYNNVHKEGIKLYESAL